MTANPRTPEESETLPEQVKEKPVKLTKRTERSKGTIP